MLEPDVLVGAGVKDARAVALGAVLEDPDTVLLAAIELESNILVIITAWYYNRIVIVTSNS